MRINNSQEQSESIQELHDDSEEQYEVSIIPLEQERNEGEVSARRKVRVIQKSFSTIQDKIWNFQRAQDFYMKNSFIYDLRINKTF